MNTTNTTSLCPECLKPLPAKIYEENGKIMIEKECPEHGTFKNTYWSDSELYDLAAKAGYIGDGINNPQTHATSGCPQDCGLCENHESQTILGLIDVTNRCNLKCPICFANAAVSKKIYEPTFEEIHQMLINLRENKPVATPAIQYSGGEPTVRKDIVDLIKLAKDEGFSHTQIATNGLRLASRENLAKELKEAGLNTVYLAFDGMTPAPYIANRGRDLLPEKLKAIENCRAAGLGVVLVPTIVKGINEDQIGDIISFAIENMDIIHGVNFQPVAFAGRTPAEEVEEQRITIPDFVKLVEKQTNKAIQVEDFYTASAVAPVSEFVEALSDGERQVTISCHQHCGAATYIFIEDDEIIPITQFIDVDKFLNFMTEGSEIVEKGGIGSKAKIIAKGLKELPKTVDNEKAPDSINMNDILKTIFKEKSYKSLGDFHKKSLLISCMHFMDPFNFDTHRVSRCVIHYATPDGKIIPFCTMNSIYREEIEEKFSVPMKNQ